MHGRTKSVPLDFERLSIEIKSIKRENQVLPKKANSLRSIPVAPPSSPSGIRVNLFSETQNRDGQGSEFEENRPKLIK